jgi:hypothetical protein
MVRWSAFLLVILGCMLLLCVDKSHAATGAANTGTTAAATTGATFLELSVRQQSASTADEASSSSGSGDDETPAGSKEEDAGAKDAPNTAAFHKPLPDPMVGMTCRRAMGVFLKRCVYSEHDAFGMSDLCRRIEMMYMSCQAGKK